MGLTVRISLRKIKPLTGALGGGVLRSGFGRLESSAGVLEWWFSPTVVVGS